MIGRMLMGVASFTNETSEFDSYSHPFHSIPFSSSPRSELFRVRFKAVEEVVIEYQSLALSRHTKLKGDHSGLERLMTKDNIGIALVLQLTQAPPIVSKAPANKMRGRTTVSKAPARVMIANTHIHWDPTLKDVKLMQTQL